VGRLAAEMGTEMELQQMGTVFREYSVKETADDEISSPRYAVVKIQKQTALCK
jgi:hypothetical protein